MNQIQKRLSIINLAISITDIETIQLQISRLRLLGDDTRIQEIIQSLESNNYAFSQKLIKNYIDTPIQKVHQRTTVSNEAHTQKEQELIKQFDLFVEGDRPQKKKPAETSEPKDTRSGYEALLDVKADEILPDNIQIETDKKDEFFKEKEHIELVTDEVKKDTFFHENREEKKPETELDNTDTVYDQEKDIEPEKSSDDSFFFNSEPSTQEGKEIEDQEETEQKQSETTVSDDLTQESLDEETETEADVETQTDEQEYAEEETTDDTDSVTEEESEYPPILSIKQQFEENIVKYTPLEESEKVFPTVNAWLKKIKETGYTQSEVREIIDRIMNLAHSSDIDHRVEATELLLISSVTEDLFAQLILARELYKGKLFKKDVNSAFQMINQLAQKEYPEAICDLAQFYEFGIATKKDRKKAKSLYQSAMDMGITRAEKHYQRIKKESGVFSF